MESFVFFMVILACVLSVVLLWLCVSAISLRKKNHHLHQQLTVSESDLIRAKESLHHFEKRIAKNQEQHHPLQNSQKETFELRRDNARAKEEIKRFKEDLRMKDIEFKKLEALHIDKLYLTSKEKDVLLNQLKELDASHSSQLHELKQDIVRLRAQEKELKAVIGLSEKQTKSNISKVISLQSKLKVAEQEIDKLSKENKAKLSPSSDASGLQKWKDRAICAKKMYLLMRQMRELSDNKLQTYQDGIIVMAEWVLNNTKTPNPQINENENKADRLLAEAWTAIISTSHIPESINTYEQVTNTRV